MTDAQLIDDLGGPTKVAELLNFDKPNGVQRVQNWITRGIPAQVKVNYPELFMRRLLAPKVLIESAVAQKTSAQTATENIASEA